MKKESLFTTNNIFGVVFTKNKKVLVLLLVLLLFFSLSLTSCKNKQVEKNNDVLEFNSTANISVPFKEDNSPIVSVEETLEVEGENANNNTCSEGYYFEDGVCVKKSKVEEYVKKKPSYSSSFSSGSINTNIQNNNNQNNNQNNSNNDNQSTPNVDSIISQIPDGFKDTFETIIGDKKDFELLLDILKETNDSEENDLFENFTGIQGIEDFQNFDPLMKGMLFEALKKSKAKSIDNFFNGVSNLFSGIQFQKVDKSTYSEGYNQFIDKIETVFKEDDKRLNIYYKSMISWYTFTRLKPTTIYVDFDNDGDWDLKYVVVYNEDNNKAYVNIIKKNDPQILTRELQYDVSENKVSLKLGSEILGNQRVFFWIGESETGLRYPRMNDLILYLDNGKLEKNSMKYTIVFLDELKVKDDGDIAQEGEISLFTQTLFSKPLEEINSEEARRLIDYKNRGIVGEDEIPDWFAFWLFKSDKPLDAGVYFMTNAFPMLKWVEMNDNDVLFSDDTSVISGLPMFATYKMLLDDSKIVFFSTSVLDYDDWPSTITDKTGWLLAKLIDSAATGSIAGQLITYSASLMYYGVAGEYKSFEDIMREVFNAFFKFFGSPDFIGSPSVRLNNYPQINHYYTSTSKDAIAKYVVKEINVPTVPLNVEVKMNKVKIRDRSDYLRGEFYMYGRVCMNIDKDGFNTGISFSYPKKAFGSCVTNKLAHGRVKVWDGDKVMKNFKILEATVRNVPFVYVEFQGWDEDQEDKGDDDDPMGLLTRTILLDEKNFEWSIDSNIPKLYYQEEKHAKKTNIDFEVKINE